LIGTLSGVAIFFSPFSGTEQVYSGEKKKRDWIGVNTTQEDLKWNLKKWFTKFTTRPFHCGFMKVNTMQM
jgi:hypothetical protein